MLRWKVLRIAAVLKGAKMPFNWHTEVGIEGGKWRTVDFTLTSKHHIVCVEVDDGGGHKSRRQKAELERMEAIANAMHDRPPAGRPVTFIRYNADAYTVDGVERTTPRAKREARLVKAIRDARKYHEERLTIVYMYYDIDGRQGSCDAGHPWADRIHRGVQVFVRRRGVLMRPYEGAGLRFGDVVELKVLRGTYRAPCN